MTFNLCPPPALLFFPFIKQIKFQCLKLKVFCANICSFFPSFDCQRANKKLWDKSNGNKRKLKRKKIDLKIERRKNARATGILLLLLGALISDDSWVEEKSTKCFFHLPAFFSVLVLLADAFSIFITYTHRFLCITFNIYR